MSAPSPEAVDNISEKKTELTLAVEAIKKIIEDLKKNLLLDNIADKKIKQRKNFENDSKALADIEENFQMLMALKEMLDKVKKQFPKINAIDALSEEKVEKQLKLIDSLKITLPEIITVGLKRIHEHLDEKIKEAEDRREQETKEQEAAENVRIVAAYKELTAGDKPTPDSALTVAKHLCLVISSGNVQETLEEHLATLVSRVVAVDPTLPVPVSVSGLLASAAAGEREKHVQALLEQQTAMQRSVNATKKSLVQLTQLQSDINALLTEVSDNEKAELQQSQRSVRGYIQTLTGICSSQEKTLSDTVSHLASVLAEQNIKSLPCILYDLQSAYSLLSIKIENAEKMQSKIDIVSQFVLTLNAKPVKDVVQMPLAVAVPLWNELPDASSVVSRALARANMSAEDKDKLQKNEGCLTLGTFKIGESLVFDDLSQKISAYKNNLAKKTPFNKTWHEEKKHFVDFLLNLKFNKLDELKEKIDLMKKMFPHYRSGLRSELLELVTELETTIISSQKQAPSPASP